MAAVLFFIAAIGAIAGAIGVVALRNPFYSVLALVCHLLSLAALFLLLRAGVRRRRPGRRLRRRGDGALRLRRRLRRRRRRAARTAPGPACASRAPLFAGALLVELCIAMLGSGLKAIGSQGAGYDPASARPRRSASCC